MKFNTKEVANLLNVNDNVFINNRDKFEDIINSCNSFEKSEVDGDTIYEFEYRLELKDDREICKELLYLIKSSYECRYTLYQTDIMTICDIVQYIYDSIDIININNLADGTPDYYTLQDRNISVDTAESILEDLVKIKVIKDYSEECFYFDKNGDSICVDEMDYDEDEISVGYKIELEEEFLKRIVRLY